MRKSKYASLGIMEFIERKLYGGTPKFGYDQFYESVNSSHPMERRLYSKKMYSLDKRGFIKYLNAQEFVVTRRGLKRLNFVRLQRLTLANKKRDGFWRVIIFDIPEKRRAARFLLRDKLLKFECHQLQKSVYVTPYICEKEINELIQLLDINKYVIIIIAKSLGSKEGIVEKRFN